MPAHLWSSPPDVKDGVSLVLEDELALVHCEALQAILSVGGSNDRPVAILYDQEAAETAIAVNISQIIFVYASGLKTCHVRDPSCMLPVDCAALMGRHHPPNTNNAMPRYTSNVKYHYSQVTHACFMFH
jgi:hypothetical protein